jgi:SpoVK/Ycf46/Vps4 family AAA+-type ATPase
VDCQNDIVKERAKERSDKDLGSLGNNTNKVDLSFLLNLLDGVLENPGRIIIMTSNFPDTLDSALIRPGRIDVIAKFRNCTNTTVIHMIEFFYDIVLSDMEKTRIRGLKEGILTPAELSKIMFECFSDYKETIQQLETLSEHYVPRIDPDNALLSINDIESINDSEIVTRELTTDALATDENKTTPVGSLNSNTTPLSSKSELDTVTRLDPVANLAMERAAVLPIQKKHAPHRGYDYGYEPNKMSVFPIQSYNPNEIGAALYE